MCKTIGNHIVSKIVLMVVLCTGVAFQASSQGLRLEFPDNKATYQEIFREIEAQGSVRFAYKSQDFEGVGPVDVPQGGQLTLGEILDYIFKDTDYRYVLDGEHIFITKEKQEPVYDTPQTRLRRSVNPNASKPRAGTRELVSPGVDSTFKEVRHVSNTEPVCLNLDRMTGRNVPQNDHTHDLATIRSLHIVQNGSAAEIAFDIRIGPRAVNKQSYDTYC